MKITYFHDTDTLYIEFRPVEVSETRELDENTLLEIDAMFGTRASCHRFEANQFRLLLAALAYTLMHRLRRIALVGTELERDAVSGVNYLGRPAKIIVVDYRAQHDPRAPAQDRRGDPAQHAPHPPDARLAPSDARGVRRRCPPHYFFAVVFCLISCFIKLLDETFYKIHRVNGNSNGNEYIRCTDKISGNKESRPG